MRISLLLSVLIFAALPTRVHAEPTRAAVSEADALFREGKTRLAAGDYVTACPLLAASFDKDPATGTLLALAVCHERQGDLVSALRAYRDVVQRAHAEGRGDRRDAAQARVTVLEALANENRSATPEAEATPEPATPTVTETPEPTVAPEPAAAAEPVAAPVAEPEPIVPMEAPASAPRSASSSRSRSEGGMSILQGAGWATLGVGVFGLGTSLAFTLQAIRKNNDSKDGCMVNRCTPEGANDRNDARASGTAATITGLIATALVAGGVAMVIFGGPSEESASGATAQVAPLLAPQLVGASATGTF